MLRHGHVSCGEMSPSEPLMKHRKVHVKMSKLGGFRLDQDKSKGYLITAWVASGVEVA